MNNKTFIFAGGGTGGHLFPAIAIAQELKKLCEDSRIIFIGTKNRIEAKVVPEYGFEFRAIWISGFSRKINLSNLIFPLKVIVSMIQSFLIILKDKPAVVIGTGGYVSGPALRMAMLFKKPTVLQDHNSFPGITTKILAKKANEVHLAFEDAKKYLNRLDNVFVSGFPVRGEFKKIDRNAALKFFNLSDDKKVILATGGSLGSRTINNAIRKYIRDLSDDVQIIWQTGSLEYDKILNEFQSKNKNIKIYKFIKDMNIAYSACDIAVTRAGATTIGEIINMEVPAILVPFPFAAEDHQTKNARSLVDIDAALMIKDNELEDHLTLSINILLQDADKLELLKDKLKSLNKSNSAKIIAERILKLAKI